MSESATVRTRFAPSPTGPLHIGGARTALFSWLLARRHSGQFILRLEDTDRKRYVPGSESEIFAGLRWLGLEWDEGPDIGGPHAPYVQSERKADYQAISARLVRQGDAYPCFCTAERLSRVSEEKRARGEQTGYDRHCRELAPSDAAQRIMAGEAHVIRLRAPLAGQTVATDLIRGPLQYENARLQDIVLLKSDGLPTYHLAVVVDDRAMRISHVTRAVEWLSSFPLHVLLWHALGWEMPQFAHLPVLLNPNGKGKLSKRHAGFQHDGQTVPVLVSEFKEAGYHGPAVANFLTNIGWAFGEEREVFSLEEAAARFEIARVNAANSVFPIDKLRWLNGVYIREHMSTIELAQHLRGALEAADYVVNVEMLCRVAPLVAPRIKTFGEVVALAGFLFATEFVPPTAQMLVPRKLTTGETLAALRASHALIASFEAVEATTMHARFVELAGKLNMKNGPLFGCVRVALTGKAVSTPTFETMEIIGKCKTLRRIELAISLLAAVAPDRP